MTDEPEDRPYHYETLYGIPYEFAGEWDQDPVPMFSVEEIVATLRAKADQAERPDDETTPGDPRTRRWCAQLLEDGFPPGSKLVWADIGVFLAPHTADCA